MRRASASTLTTGSMTRIRRSTSRANSFLADRLSQQHRWAVVFLVFRSAHQHRRDDQHRRQDELRLYRPHLAHSDLQGVLLRGRVRRRGQHLAVAQRARPRQHGLPLRLRESGGFGYQFNEHWDIIANIEHISHASLCTSINPGLTQVGAEVGYKFERSAGGFSVSRRNRLNKGQPRRQSLARFRLWANQKAFRQQLASYQTPPSPEPGPCASASRRPERGNAPRPWDRGATSRSSVCPAWGGPGLA